MATITKFEELEVWQLARKQSQLVYDASQNQSFRNNFSLRDQIERASGSVMDNIAEEFDRDRNKEFIHFLSISKGSNSEVRSQLYRALDRNHINLQIFNEMYDLNKEIGVKVNRLMTYLINSDYKGKKFKK